KRFAQGIGTALSTAAAVAWLGFGASGVGVALVAAIAFAAFLEAAFAVCLGCIAYGYLAKAGVLNAADCPECADISLRLPANDSLAPRT
ncbi:MAG: DUF4395 family protein, partial [Microthrixaceae bacterium]|nr:DUF4395 family protein [Microthrixaceae bacterium]